MAYVYWITNNVEEDMFKYGYVGITSKTVDYRISTHKRNYSKFTTDGKTGGCLKLYSEINKLGGFDKVSVVVICEGDINYCLSLENKIRPTPYLGWNIRVGGDTPIMHGRKITEQTKAKLAEVRKKWVMSQETRLRVSINRKGSGNPMYNTPPWLNPASNSKSIYTWLHCDIIFKEWKISQLGVKSLSNHFTELNYWTIDTMIRKFKLGWNPMTDKSWVIFKESYDTTKS